MAEDEMPRNTNLINVFNRNHQINDNLKLSDVTIYDYDPTKTLTFKEKYKMLEKQKSLTNASAF